jgi:hypothetical protein
VTRTNVENEMMFGGVVEVYNASARANAIRSYAFRGKRQGAGWQPIESELNQETQSDQTSTRSNVTPLPLAPYSGVEVRVAGFIKMAQPEKLQVRIEVEDLFGKRYRVEVTATP